jgi:hypothetical protein
MLIACFFLSTTAFAQNENDALRYSMQGFGTTARSLSMGGAFGSLGADFSSLSINPAGIAIYRKSEFTFSPVLQFSKNDATYLGTFSTDNQANLGVGNLGFVLAFPKEKKQSGWKGTALGFGYNRINSFSSRISFEGTNSANSINNYFAQISNGISNYNLSNDDQYQFDAGLAYNSYLTNPVADTSVNDQYQAAMLNSSLKQKGLITRKGAQGEIVISFGANYDDKIYLGATVGLPYMRYSSTSVYEEIAVGNTLKDSLSGKTFRSSKYTQKVSTQGNGVNLKLGLIYKPIDLFRFGVAIQTPTYYEMNDQYSSKIYANFAEGYSENISPQGKFAYNLTTPFRATLSAGFIFMGQGLISIDYDYENFSTANLGSTEYGFTDENRLIKDRFTAAQTLHFGGEYKYQIFSFRAGAVLQASPYDGQFNFTNGNRSAISYTGGLGIKGESFFLDLGFSTTKAQGTYSPYQLIEGNAPTAGITNVSNRFMMTFGFKF